MLAAEINKLQRHAHGRILIVEDEPMCLTGMRALLKACGIDVDSCVDFALNGREAVDSVKAA